MNFEALNLYLTGKFGHNGETTYTVVGITKIDDCDNLVLAWADGEISFDSDVVGTRLFKELNQAQADMSK